MSAFFGNMLIALRTSISATTLSAVANATTSSVTASVSGGRGVYTYLWTSSGTGCTITSPTAATTTFTGSSTAGSTSVYCAITDTITGNTLNTPTCGITWTAIPVPVTQNVVISGVVTYNTLAQSYTLTGTPASPAPTGNPPQFIYAGTYTSPQITVTPGSGYVLGSVTGSFVISRAPITGMSFTLNGASFTTAQTRTAGTTYTIAVSSVTPSGATYSPTSLTASTAGSYSLSCSGTVNYTGTRTSPVLTITSPPAALSVSLPFIAGGGTTTQTMPTTITGGVPPYTLVSWVKNSGSGVFGGTSVNSAVVNKQISVNTNFVCTVTIRDSVFTQASGSGTINWLIA